DEEHPARVGPSGNRAAETVARALAGEGQKDAAGLARVDVGPAGPGAAGVVARGADDHVGIPVAIHVAGPRSVTPEAVVLVLRLECPEHLAVAARVDVSAPAPRCPGDDVGRAVVVGVSRRLDAGPDLIVGAAVGGPEQP